MLICQVGPGTHSLGIFGRCRARGSKASRRHQALSSSTPWPVKGLSGALTGPQVAYEGLEKSMTGEHLG